MSPDETDQWLADANARISAYEKKYGIRDPYFPLGSIFFGLVGAACALALYVVDGHHGMIFVGFLLLGVGRSLDRPYGEPERHYPGAFSSFGMGAIGMGCLIATTVWAVG